MLRAASHAMASSTAQPKDWCKVCHQCCKNNSAHNAL